MEVPLSPPRNTLTHQITPSSALLSVPFFKHFLVYFCHSATHNSLASPLPRPLPLQNPISTPLTWDVKSKPYTEESFPTTPHIRHKLILQTRLSYFIIIIIPISQCYYPVIIGHSSHKNPLVLTIFIIAETLFSRGFSLFLKEFLYLVSIIIYIVLLEIYIKTAVRSVFPILSKRML